MKYTGISIGPIIATLSQVRKPRHLWSASYLFSHLMSIIIEEGELLGGKETLISPAKDCPEKPEGEQPKSDLSEKDTLEIKSTTKKGLGIGLYPDRAFFSCEIDVNKLTENVFYRLHSEIGIGVKELNDYFNIMGLSIAANSESEAIGKLNQMLDVLELSNRCEDSEARRVILQLIAKRKKSPLFKKGFGDENFDIPYLALIAAKELESKSTEWESIKKFVDTKNIKKIGKEAKHYHDKGFITEEEYKSWLDFLNESDFFEKLSESNELKQFFKSYHKYFCVVQADGDNMGQVIGNLKDGVLKELSASLIEFGKEASELVRAFGGLPIYAGGDDLLFIAPVVSEIKIDEKCERATIFNLIDAIDTKYNAVVVKQANLLQKDKPKTTSMSYGISINYYKYPLYEVLEDARNLLFVDAKENRNTIACRLRKHSGSSFRIILNKSDNEIVSKFRKLTEIEVKETIVSATAHKLRENSVLWQSTCADKNRLASFFKTIMGLGEKKSEQNDYLSIVNGLLLLLLKKKESILPELFTKRMEEDVVKQKIANEIQKEISEKNIQQHQIEPVKENIKKKIKKEIFEELNRFENNKLNEIIFSMLRIAKFINGEEVKDE